MEGERPALPPQSTEKRGTPIHSATNESQFVTRTTHAFKPFASRNTSKRSRACNTVAGLLYMKKTYTPDPKPGSPKGTVGSTKSKPIKKPKRGGKKK